jgi:hypothetical protein
MRLVDATERDRYQEGRAFWRCSRFPSCLGTHGAHADGRPLGIPGDRATNKARLDAHAIFDRLWKERFVPDRDAAYAWLRSVMRMNEEAAHFARFSIGECERAADFAIAFIEGWSRVASPIVNIFPDPWGLAPAGVDPDALDRIEVGPFAAVVITPTALSTDVVCENPEGW